MFLDVASRYLMPIGGPAEPPMPHVLDGHEQQEPQRELEVNGIALLRGFVPEVTCEWLLSRVSDHRHKHTPTWLNETASLGRRGCYFDKNWNLPPLLHIQEKIVQSLGLSPTAVGTTDAKLPLTNSKSVLLGYTEGAENWAHQVR